MSYSALTRRYFETAPGAGALEGPDVLHGEAGSRSSGTWVRFDVRLTRGAPAATRGAPAAAIDAVRFRAFGCPHVIAVAAWVAEQAAGRPPVASLPEPIETLRERFAVPIEKTGRLLIVEDAWRAACRGAGSPAGPTDPPAGSGGRSRA